ncbi:MAG: Lrp/AsnC family transcriptional regulator [Alphaproteobacteria bacterium]|jgi:Lrp/AsnC family transcriptional regulator
MDKIDQKILSHLQRDAAIPIADLARAVGLSTTPCWRRVQKLEADGVIKAKVALLDADQLGLGLTAFMAVTTNRHNREWLDHFAHVVVDFPEVVEFHRLAGTIDYLLKVMVPTMQHYDDFYKRLVARVEISEVSSWFAMERIKETTMLPLHHIPQ